MDSKIAEQILDELAPTFEAIETQSAALMQFLKEKGIATDEQLAPYLEQAAAASSVRWRALRVRMVRLFSMAEKTEDENITKEVSQEKAADAQAAQGSDAKKEDLGSKPGKAPGSKERADVDRQSTEGVSVAKGPETKGQEAAKPNDNKDAAQNEPTGPARSEQVRTPKDEAEESRETPESPEKKNAA